jgi:glucose 1-dehydrogenase
VKISQELQTPLVAVSGGLGDIGKAIAQSFKREGADIAIADLPKASVETEHYCSGLDVTDADAVETWFDDVVRHFGRSPNIIIPNAAISTIKRYFEISSTEWKREIDVNLNGAFYFANAGATRLLRESRPGRIVFLGSWAGHAPHVNLPAYSVAKAGLRMLMKTLALELAARGILVNEVAPGYVDAGLSGRIFETNPDIKEDARNRVPVRRLVSADEVARQALYLCSEDARHITGTTLLQDGGLSLLQGPFTQ